MQDQKNRLLCQKAAYQQCYFKSNFKGSNAYLFNTDLESNSVFNNFCGVINQEDVQRFRRIFFRASKNNVIMSVEQVDQKITK